MTHLRQNVFVYAGEEAFHIRVKFRNEPKIVVSGGVIGMPHVFTKVHTHCVGVFSFFKPIHRKCVSKAVQAGILGIIRL